MSVPSDRGFERRMLGEVRVDLTLDNKIRGMAIAFNSQSLDLGGFTEFIAPEAVDRTLRDALDVRALVDHDSSKIIGRTRAGTLLLQKQRGGLQVEIDPPNTSYAKDVIESVSRGDISGMSFGFRTLADEWNFEGAEPVRTITDMIISEVSIVSFPAYPATDVQVAQRSLQEYRQAQGGSRIDFLRRVHKTRLAR